MESQNALSVSVLAVPWTWAAATSSFIVVICSLIIYLWWQHPLYGRNRGPKAFPLVGCLPQALRNSDRLYDWWTDELKKTPTMTMRMIFPGISFLETANPANVEHMLKTRTDVYKKGEFFHLILFDVFGRGLLNVDGESWKLQRKVALQEFNSRTLRDFVENLVHSELKNRLIPILDSSCSRDECVDMQDLLLRFTFDTICQLSFGTDPAGLDPSLPSVPFARAFNDAVFLVTQRFWPTFPSWQVQKYLNIGNEKKLRDSLLVINAFASNVIQARRKELANGEGDQRLDLLSRFLRVADEAVRIFELDQKQDPRGKNDQSSDLFLRDMIVSFIMAGRDTSASGLTWFFWLLLQNPRVEVEIHREIQATIASRKSTLKISQNESCDTLDTSAEFALFSFEELKELHYLHAALTESMRIFPPVPDDSKIAEVDDVLPDGTFVAKGTRVSFHIYAMGRNANIWGPDFLEFRPERFLENGFFVPPSPFKYPVFLGGPRMCIGKDMAMSQMKLIAAALISRYTFSIKEGHFVQHDWNMTMKVEKGLPLQVHRRGPS